MAVTDALRGRLQRVAPATSGRLSPAAFLLSGAATGLLGWGGTQAITWLSLPRGTLLATALWAVLATGFVGVSLLHAPDEIRFSTVLFVWGGVIGTATLLTVGGLVGVVPADVAFWHAWVAAMAVGYCWTGGLLEGAGQPARGRGYLGAGVVALALLGVGVSALDLVAPVRYLALASIHAIPLLLDVRTALPATGRSFVVALAVAAVLVVGVAL